ncbi:MAG TPA: phage tail tape measure protein [Paracoccus sp. (in: a-proteobacteria)]|uniref:phage tail tape measure protein n=1 Tax=Paracoccus sp. TaxID=267 RepID=UPI002C4EAA0B|nr:phage tail tape measure protein [Paracoccus sp. (in: a-proteobacteria)]HWL56414.1 phage tail tape measure protein [Paracoccus sp. (in: a-proteobacteria)]
MADDERLVVRLEARINDFEKSMKRAENTGTRTYQGLRRNSRSATRQMEQDMARSANSIKQSVASVTGSVGSLGKSLAGGFLGGLAVGGMAEIVSSSRQVVQGIAQIGNEAKRAGLSAQAFQEWKYVAEANRISVDALVDGFKELSLRADEFITTGVGPAAEAFGRLGFRAEDLKKKLKDPSALMLEIMQRLEGMDRAAQIRIADEIFGGTGGERFVEMLGQGDDRLRDTIARAHETGAVLDDELIAKAQDLDQRFRDLQTTAGNFFKRVIVGAADAAVEIADMRAKLDEVFSNETEGRAALGDDLYDALNRNRDLVDQHAAELGTLEGQYQSLAEEAAVAGNALRGSIGQLDSWGYGEIADQLRGLVAEQDELVRAFRDGAIGGDDFAVKLDDIRTRATDAFDELEAGDRTSFEGVISQLGRLGGVIAGVVSLAGRLKGALASAAGVSAGQKDLDAMRQRQAAEQASMDSAKAMAEANDKFTASETARNAATKEQIALDREMAEVRKRAKDMGATLTDSDVRGFAEAALAGDAARAPAGKAGGSSRSKAGGGDSLKGFDRDLQQIRERTEALNIEAQVLSAAALSGASYGDMMSYASEKARLLAAAQEEGRAITPELAAQIDQLAEAYAQAGKKADEAADRLREVQEAGKAGADAVAGIFMAALDGADAAKRAVVQLLDQLAQAMISKAFSGLAASGGGAGGIFTGIGKLLGFDGGGYTGNGPRTGGVDGKGGFLAVMHPRETVTDHTKGQTAPGGNGGANVHITVGVDPKTGNLTAFVDQRAAAQVQRAAPSIVGQSVREVNNAMVRTKSFGQGRRMY